MPEIKYYDPSFVPGEELVYSIVSARYGNKWLFVRHHGRMTWEITGGHIEEGETSYEAAGRELKEETGAVSFTMTCVATYSVKSESGKRGYGRLYHADVKELGPIGDSREIAEVMLSDHLPLQMTYPEIQESFYRYVKVFLNG